MMLCGLESLRGSFNRSLRVEGKADRTLVLYGQSITYFGQWLAQRGRPADLSSLDRDTVLQWFDHLRSRGLTTGTIRTRWRGLRRFVNWLLAEGIVGTDPLAGIVIDKPPPPVPILTDEDLAALVGACRGKRFADRRDEAVMRLLIDCGLRVSEVTGIDLDHLDLDAESITVTGKGSRVRAAYFGAKTGQALDRYLRERRITGTHLARRCSSVSAAASRPMVYANGSKCAPTSPASTPPRSTHIASGTPTLTTFCSPAVRSATSSG
jgi:site-specific recombinase XerC